MQQKMIALFLLSLSNFCYAEICPNIADIQKHNLRGWKIYDTYDDKLLSAQHLAHFKAQIKQFALAEWPDENNKNATIHCYYLDKDGSNMNAYLAKDNFRPDYSENWYKVSGSLQCAAGMDKCKFQRKLHAQLARR